MRWIIKSDYQEMSSAAARIVANSILANPRLSLCLAAGNTPTGTYRELTRMYKSDAVDFSKAKFFYLDDYFGLPANHPESFRSYLERELFRNVNVTRANIHGPDLNYEETIRESGGLDLMICGIGMNGHIAFNEPGSSMDSRTRVVDLAESTIDGLRGKFTTEELPRQAVTMGLATILETREILLLASGQDKKEILRRAFKGPVTTNVPASVLQRHPNVTVITDQAIE